MGEKRAKGELPFLDLPRQDISPIAKYMDGVRDRFDTFVVAGIGGSALGNIAAHTALRHPYHNYLPNDKRGGMRLEVPDNVDPDRLAGLFDTLVLHRTLFNVVTKSGSTAETTSAFLVIKERLQKDPWGRRQMARPHRRHHRSEEGRSPETRRAGKTPRVRYPAGRRWPVQRADAGRSALDGGDGKRHPRSARRSGRHGGPGHVRRRWKRNPAYVSAAIHFLMYNHPKKAKPLAVMMPYANALRDVADWFRQLWAESLGKEKSLSGETGNIGPTPIKALGATDQHSQVQLYAEGPNDKLFTFVGVDRFHDELAFHSDPDLADLNAFNYFGGKSMGDLLRAEQVATTLALTRKGRPNVTITLPEVNAYTLGQLFMLLEVQTVVAGWLHGIDPFDQPGVEAGKIATYALFHRPGYDEERQQIEAELARGKARVL